MCVPYVTTSKPALAAGRMGAGRPRNICRDRLNLERKKDSYKTPGDTTREIDTILRNDSAAKGKPLRYISGYGHRRAWPV